MLGENTLKLLPKFAPVLIQRHKQDLLLHGDILENILQANCPIESLLCPACSSQAQKHPEKVCAIATLSCLCHAGCGLVMAWIRLGRCHCREWWAHGKEIYFYSFFSFLPCMMDEFSEKDNLVWRQICQLQNSWSCFGLLAGKTKLSQHCILRLRFKPTLIRKKKRQKNRENKSEKGTWLDE